MKKMKKYKINPKWFNAKNRPKWNEKVTIVVSGRSVKCAAP